MEAICLSVCMLVTTGGDSKGLSWSDNFSIMAPNQQLADELLEASEAWRDAISKAWFGEPLPQGAGKTVIHLQISEDTDRGVTSPKMRPDWKANIMWLHTSRDKALGCTLAHEMTHVVFSTRYGGALPIWANEGAASLQDDDESARVRQGILQSFAESDSWPDLLPMLESTRIERNDQAAYAVVTSLTEFLLHRGDRKKFLEFATNGNKIGWSAAAQRFYNFPDLRSFEIAWRDSIVHVANDDLRLTSNVKGGSRFVESERRR